MPQGRAILGWADHDSRTVYVWADEVPGPHEYRMLKRVLWHEAAHTYGIHDEWLADVFAWCSVTPAEREGIGYMAPLPTEADCHRVP